MPKFKTDRLVGTIAAITGNPDATDTVTIMLTAEVEQKAELRPLMQVIVEYSYLDEDDDWTD